MFRRRKILTVLFICLLLSIPQLFLFSADLDRAITNPTVSGNLYPLYITGPQIVPASAVLLLPGTIALSSSLSYGNNFIVEELQSDLTTVNLELDSEVWFLRFAAAIGIFDRLEVGVELQSSGQYGGFLDPIISGFHHLFGLPDGSREIRDYNRNSLIIYQGDALILNETGPVYPALFFTIEPKFSLFRGERSALSLSLWTGIPIIPVRQALQELAKTEGIAVAPRILGAAQWRSFSFQTGTGFLFQDGELSFLANLSAAWNIDSLFIPVIGISGRSSPYDFGYKRSDLFSATVNIGTFLDFPELGRFQVIFTEEFFTFAAADIGFHIGWSRLFP